MPHWTSRTLPSHKIAFGNFAMLVLGQQAWQQQLIAAQNTIVDHLGTLSPKTS